MEPASLCVHGHFYQPPREDPLTGTIPQEVGATPHRNWNERIHAECYRPNAALGNFARMSFNFGPTLFSWMRTFDPATYQRIIAQDRANVERYGVGNAMAQSYHHTILPLASYADKVTQISWGIADFEYHFGRRPQGMWLPETAVDTETLTVLADHGIEFTILAPWQADAPFVDTTEPYRVALPEGRSITVFFYHQDLSGQMSFDPGMTTNADAFVRSHLMPRYMAEKAWRGQPQLVLVASDGELYGHHQPFRDKFLAYLLGNASTAAGIEPTYPARWLRDHPPRQTIRIRERTSWSCHHGVTRWMDECGCTPSTAWKAHLRHSLNHMAALVDEVYSKTVQPYIADPWQLRHRYIHVVLGHQSAADLIHEAAGRRLNAELTNQIGMLLQAQFERQRAFTSCGWFFEDFDRIEPKNNVRYMAQAVWLTRRATGIDLTARGRTELQKVISQRTGRSGDQIFARHLQRA